MVAPKRQSLEHAESSLAEQMANLETKQLELKAVTDKLTGLQDDLEAKQNEKKVGEGEGTTWLPIMKFLLDYKSFPCSISMSFS